MTSQGWHFREQTWFLKRNYFLPRMHCFPSFTVWTNVYMFLLLLFCVSYAVLVKTGLKIYISSFVNTLKTNPDERLIAVSYFSVVQYWRFPSCQFPGGIHPFIYLLFALLISLSQSLRQNQVFKLLTVIFLSDRIRFSRCNIFTTAKNFLFSVPLTTPTIN